MPDGFYKAVADELSRLGFVRKSGGKGSQNGPSARFPSRSRGGWRSGRPAEISVADVCRAGGAPFFARPLPGPDNPAHCAIERPLQATRQSALTRAETVLADTLAQQSIADLAGGLRHHP